MSWSAGLAAAEIPVLIGPTAVGKTAVALALAGHLPIEIISADSRQVFRRLDIATAKPTRREQRKVPHHGLDLVAPGHRYSAGRFAADAARWIAEIEARDRMPVVVGGTGLYVKALVDGLFLEPALDPVRRRRLEEWLGGLDPADLVRWAGRLDPGFRGGGRQRATRAAQLPLLTGYPLSHWQRTARSQGVIRPWYVQLTVPRPVLHRRILVRAEEMVRRGMIEEVAAVLAEGAQRGSPGLDGVGVREAVEYLHGERPRDSVVEAVSASTRRYAKRQVTWFRHQLREPVMTLDATRPPDELAHTIAEAWRTRTPQVPSRRRAAGATTV